MLDAEDYFQRSLEKYSRYFSKAQILKAKSYYRQGRAYLELAHDTIVGVVKGSEKEPYVVNLEFNNKNNVDIVNSECTCEAGYHCVHILVCSALYDMNYKNDKNDKKKPEPLIPMMVDKTLSFPDSTQIKFFQGSEPASPTVVQKVEWQMFFAYQYLENFEFHGPVVIPMLQYLRKDGGLGRTAPYSEVKPHLPPDQELRQLYELFRLRRFKFIPWAEFWYAESQDLRSLLRNVYGQPLNVSNLKTLTARPQFHGWPGTDPKVFFKMNWTADTEVKSFEPEHFIIFSHELWFFSGASVSFANLPFEMLNPLMVILNKSIWTHTELVGLRKELETLAPKPFELDYPAETIRLLTPDFQPVWFITQNRVGGIFLEFGAWSPDTGFILPSKDIKLEYNESELKVYKPVNEVLDEFTIRSIKRLISWDIHPQQVSVPDVHKRFLLDIPISSFLTQFGKQLMDEGVGISIQGRQPASSSTRVSFTVSSGIDWFEVKVEGFENSNGKEGPVTHLGEGWLLVSNKVVFASEADQKAVNILLNLGWKGGSSVKVPKNDFSSIEALYAERETPTEIAAWLRVGKSLQSGYKLEPIPPPQNFIGTLRDYQGTGLHWLWFLHTYDLNGLLADDMGLGKTIQTLAFLGKWMEQNKKMGKFLIISPVTTLPNWEKEIQKFLPTLQTIRHHGLTRKKSIDALEQSGVFLVSYQTLRQDINLFRTVTWDVLILDEAQAIKNSSTQTYKSVCLLKAGRKFSLTGTPVENHMGDLWSQMDFLNPGLLGNHREFQNRFANDLDRLKTLVTPFILRRRKQDVLKDLPDKEEIIFYCEMQPEQKKFYHELREQILGSLNHTLSIKSVLEAQMEILTGILRLRQTCLFPGLADPGKINLPSTKMETLRALLEEVLSEEHKALVFSQFTQALGLIGEELKKIDMDFLYLDGKTKDRSSVVERFQSKAKEKVFLLSLKAGGVGINLTAADYVVLFDPWWNPAVENQAVDRAHRIGQHNKVTVYKLIVSDSIEEKILELQARKKNLVASLIAEEKTALKDMSADEVLSLFR